MQLPSEFGLTVKMKVRYRVPFQEGLHKLVIAEATDSLQDIISLQHNEIANREPILRLT